MRFGIKYRYPRVPLSEKLKGYLQLVKPLTLIPPFIAGYIGVVLPLIQLQFMFLSWKAVFVAISLTLAQAFGQAFNQAYGWHEDTINKPYRPIPSGIVSVSEAYSISIFLMALSVWFAYIADFVIWCILLIFLAMLYNIKLKYSSPWLSLILLSFSRGYLPFIACWSVYGNILVAEPHVIGIVIALWVFAFQPTKDIIDVEGDKRFGARTLPTVYGIERTKSFIKAAAMMPFIFLCFAIFLGFLGCIYFIFALNIFVAMYCIKTLSVSSRYFENTKSWIGFYAGIGMFYILALLGYIMEAII